MDSISNKRQRARAGRSFSAGGIPLQFERWIDCPYCGENFSCLIDASAGNQTYFEDCEICCRSILLDITVDADGNIAGITVRREDD